MNAYIEMKNKHQQEINDFPKFFAFNKEQFEEGMKKFGLSPDDTKKIFPLGKTGGFCLCTDWNRLHEMFYRHTKELQDAISGDTTGNGFIFEMFDYELADHEFIVSGDVTTTLRALGITEKELCGSEQLRHGLSLAIKAQSNE
jgi:hypothetical protein